LRTEKERGQAKEDDFLYSLPSFIVFLFLFNYPPDKYKLFNGASSTLPSFRRVLSAPLQNAENSIPDSADLSW